MQSWGSWSGASQGFNPSNASFNANFTLAEYGMPKSCIHGLPGAGEVLFGDHPDKAVEFCDKLREKLAEHPDGLRLSNIEISKVAWNSVSLELFLSMFQEKSATAVRLKAFKCGLDDEALQYIVNWIEATPAEGLPSEIHLSHNKITLEGFNKLVEVLERKWSELVKKPPPIWVRVEGNSVQDSVLQQLVKEGRAVMCRNCGARRGNEGVPLAFPGFPDKQPQHQAPATATATQAATQAASWGAGQSWDATWWPAMAAMAANAATMPAESGMAAKGTRQPIVAAAKGPGQQSWQTWQPQQQQQWQPQQKNWGGQMVIPAAAKPANIRPVAAASVVMSRGQQDRSRTPDGRSPQPPGQGSKENKPPPPWEEHWSDEYQIPYYWNPDTGESAWENPGA